MLTSQTTRKQTASLPLHLLTRKKYASVCEKRLTLYLLYTNSYDTRKKLYEKAEEIKKLGDSLTPDIENFKKRILAYSTT